MPLVLLAYLAFISMALPDSLLGVAWPAMRLSLDQPVGALGLLLPFGIATSLLSSVSTGFTLRRIGVGWLLAASTTLSAAGLVGYSLAPAFWLLLPATMLLGVGSGAIDTGLNAYAARNFGARDINWMHASYGLGATVGPLVLTGAATAGLSWRWAYGVIAAVQTLLALAFVVTSRAWRPGPAPARPSAPPRTSTPPALLDTLRHGGVWRGAALLAVQSGLESSTALWAFVFLTSARDLPAGSAAVTVSAYWAILCAARLVLGPLTERLGTHSVLTGGVVGMTTGAVLVLLPGPTWLALAGIIGIGLAAAPMFPLLTLTTAARVGHAHLDRAVGIQVAAGAAGAAALPASVGLLIGHFGADVFGPCLLVLALGTATLHARLRTPRPATAEPAS